MGRKSGTMFEVKNATAEEGVKRGIKRWIVPTLAEVQNASELRETNSTNRL